MVDYRGASEPLLTAILALSDGWAHTFPAGASVHVAGPGRVRWKLRRGKNCSVAQGESVRRGRRVSSRPREQQLIHVGFPVPTADVSPHGCLTASRTFGIAERRKVAKNTDRTSPIFRDLDPRQGSISSRQPGIDPRLLIRQRLLSDIPPRCSRHELCCPPSWRLAILQSGLLLSPSLSRPAVRRRHNYRKQRPPAGC